MLRSRPSRPSRAGPSSRQAPEHGPRGPGLPAMNAADLITTSRFYLGGMVQADVSREHRDPSIPMAIPDSFLQHISGEHELFLRVQPQRDQTATQGQLSIMLRGYAVLDAAASSATGLHALLLTLLEHYRRHQDLPVERLEGSFTIALLDGEAGRLLLFRNIVGTGFTYYTQTPEGLFFSRNLANLVRHLDTSLSPNEAVLRPISSTASYRVGRHCSPAFTG